MRIKAAILVFALWPLGAGAAKAPAGCMAGRRTALIAGYFSGPLVCNKKDATFVLVGRTAGNRYSIYNYRYRFLPPHGAVMHGGQSLVVFRGEKYVGQYSVWTPPYTTMSVRGTKVLLRSGEGEKLELDFSTEPPKDAFWSEGWLSLFR